ncbi:hypothetical protein, partial [Streptomyces puniciscabiei]|uniref:hypothetical protein n=1 Tax=Streptomyces puniciscabiei TaxID=164348 RepID=UPI00331C6465
GQMYDFPDGVDGSGHTLAIIELGGGFFSDRLDSYFSSLGMPTPLITVIEVDGRIDPGVDPLGADDQVHLDIEVTGALAPGANQSVYFAPNTAKGFIDAVSTAIHDTPTPTVLSIGWGNAEELWTVQAKRALHEAFADAAALGVTVCVAAGSSGSSDGVDDGFAHVDFPASSPRVMACGGTRLDVDATNGTVLSETVWNDGDDAATGGGFSVDFDLPSWQADAGVHNGFHSVGFNGRGVPDVAANASPASGYMICVDGQEKVLGGTSAATVLWAALVCRIAETLGRPLGPLQPALYSGAAPGRTAAGLRDITSGNNGEYSARPGWDPCTGLGTPKGTALTSRVRDDAFGPPDGFGGPPEFGEVSGIRLTVPHKPRDLQDLTHFFMLLDSIYEDCVKLTVLEQVPAELDTDHQQKLLGSLDDLSGAPRPRVKRIETGTMLLELLRDPSLPQTGAALAVLAAVLKGVEKVSTTPFKIRRRVAEENKKRAQAEADRAEAEVRAATARQHLGEVAARASEDTLTALTLAVARLYEITGGEPEVEELPDDELPEDNE